MVKIERGLFKTRDRWHEEVREGKLYFLRGESSGKARKNLQKLKFSFP